MTRRIVTWVLLSLLLAPELGLMADPCVAGGSERCVSSHEHEGTPDGEHPDDHLDESELGESCALGHCACLCHTPLVVAANEDRSPARLAAPAIVSAAPRVEPAPTTPPFRPPRA